MIRDRVGGPASPGHESPRRDHRCLLACSSHPEPYSLGDAAPIQDACVGCDGGSPPPPTPRGDCKELVLAPSSGEWGSDVVRWSDASCNERTASLIPNDRTDPGGTNGGFLRSLTYRHGPDVRTLTGTGVNGWGGFGYVVAHYGAGGDDAETTDVRGTGRTVLAGRHHAIHEYRWRLFIEGAPVDVTVHWFFATGRSHPVFSITYDTSKAGPDVVRVDSRAPYGDFAFDSDPDGEISGIG